MNRFRESIRDLSFLVLLTFAAALFAVAIRLVAQDLVRQSPFGTLIGIGQLARSAMVASAVGAGAAFIGSVSYVARHRPGWDALAGAGAEVAFGTAVIGIIAVSAWSYAAWGVWSWPKGATTLVVVAAVHAAYLVLRAFSGKRAPTVAAWWGAALGLTLPLVAWIDHPTNAGRWTRWLFGSACNLTMTLAFGGLAFALVWLRARIYRAESRLARRVGDAATVAPPDPFAAVLVLIVLGDPDRSNVARRSARAPGSSRRSEP